MKRAELVKLLELVEPALSDTNLVMVYTCFMFGKKTIAAYNDHLGIVAKGSLGTQPFATGGKPLLGLLQNTVADEVNFQLTDEAVVVKAGKSTIKLPYFKEDEFLFTEPKEKWGASIALSTEVIEGLEICLTTASNDLSKPAYLGVCFNIDKNSTKLYSTDGDAITRYTVPGGSGNGAGVYTVPTSFCEATLKINNQFSLGGEGTIELNENWAKATLNGFVIYGRMIVNDKPPDHQSVLDEHVGKKQTFSNLPLGLDGALARARVLADPESSKTVMTVEGGKLRLVTETPSGTVKDELSIKGHADVEAIVHASLVARSLTVCDQLAILDGVTAYKQGNTVLQVVANIGT